jgi:hypothetical protein
VPYEVSEQTTTLVVGERCAPAHHLVDLSRPATLVQTLLRDQIGVMTHETLLARQPGIGVGWQREVSDSG